MFDVKCLENTWTLYCRILYTSCAVASNADRSGARGHVPPAEDGAARDAAAAAAHERVIVERRRREQSGEEQGAGGHRGSCLESRAPELIGEGGGR